MWAALSHDVAAPSPGSSLTLACEGGRVDAHNPAPEVQQWGPKPHPAPTPHMHNKLALACENGGLTPITRPLRSSSGALAPHPTPHIYTISTPSLVKMAG